jgi:hypothetical protein
MVSAGRRKCTMISPSFLSMGIVLVLHPPDKLAEDVTVSTKGSGFSGITIAYLGRDENKVDAVPAQAKKLGRILSNRLIKCSGVGTAVILRIWTGFCGKSHITRYGHSMRRGT